MARILVADDQSTTRHLLTYMLGKANHTVITAENGEDAIERLSNAKFDLLITDIYMPHVDGWELLRRIREQDDLVSLPVIVFSAGNLRDLATKAKSYGATRFVAQPFSSAELSQLVDECLKGGGMAYPSSGLI